MLACAPVTRELADFAGSIFRYAAAVPLVAYLVLFAQALRYRRRVHLHAGFMLGSAFFLWEPAAARLLINSSHRWSLADLRISTRLPPRSHWASHCRCCSRSTCFLGNRKVGIPFLAVAVFLAVQVGGIYWVADTGAWRRFFGAYAEFPAMITVGSGVLLGALAAWYGWRRPHGGFKRASAD